MDIKALQTLVTEFRDERDWQKFHKPKDLAVALGIEAGELAELFLWKTDLEVEEQLTIPEEREKLADELADIFSFLLSLADITKIDLAEALRTKTSKNAIKYPVEKVRGSAKKYDRY